MRFRRIAGRPRPGSQSATEQLLPATFGAFGIAEEIEIGAGDRPLLGQLLEIHRAAPIGCVNEKNRDGWHFSGLNEGENLEQFVERAETARKYYQSIGTHRKVQLADREIMKLKSEIGRRIGVRLLLVRQTDVISDRWRAGVCRTAIGRLHDARSAAGRDHIVAYAVMRIERTAAFGGDLPE